MKKRLACVGLSALLVLLGATQANLAFAGIIEIVYNSASTQSIQSGTWKVFPATLAATNAPTLTGSPVGALAVTTFTTLSTCSTNTTSGLKAIGQTSFVMAGTITALTVGMTISSAVPGIPAGTTILTKNNGTRTITISNANTIAIASASTFAFGSGPCYQKYFSINNTGTATLSSLGIVQTVTSNATNTVQLQTCSGTWTETSGACSASTGTIMTTSGTTGTQYVAGAAIGVPSGTLVTPGTRRMRALSTQGGITTTINIVVTSSSNITAVPNTNM